MGRHWENHLPRGNGQYSPFALSISLPLFVLPPPYRSGEVSRRDFRLAASGNRDGTERDRSSGILPLPARDLLSCARTGPESRAEDPHRPVTRHSMPSGHRSSWPPGAGPLPPNDTGGTRAKGQRRESSVLERLAAAYCAHLRLLDAARDVD